MSETNWTGFLLDPHELSISPVSLPATWKSIAPAIDADLFDVVRVDASHVLYVDDEGLFKADRAYTVWHGYPNVLAGKLLLLGTTQDGETISATWTLEQVRAAVGFITAIIRTPTRYIATTDDGKVVQL